MRTNDLEASRRTVREVFPLMPPAVIEQWLLPIYSAGHWPPDASRLWTSVLREREVEFWRDVKWSRSLMHWDHRRCEELDRESLGGLTSEYAAYLRRPAQRAPQLEAVDTAVHILRETGRLEPPPILFRSNGGHFEICEGMPRLAAVRLYYAGFPLECSPQIEFWVGSHVPGSAEIFASDRSARTERS